MTDLTKLNPTDLLLAIEKAHNGEYPVSGPYAAKLMMDACERWEPIATAPEYTKVLLFDQNSMIYIGAYDPYFREDHGAWVESCDEMYVRAPTHWRPLPNPPDLGEAHLMGGK